MSRASMIARARLLPRAEISGIGRYLDPQGQQVDFPIGWAEVERDTAFAATILADWGVDSGSVLLATVPGHEIPWFGPLITALKDRGGVLACAERFGWDARRTAMFLNRVHPSAVLGLCRETLDSLTDEALSDLAQVPVVFCLPDAYLSLTGSTIASALVVTLGPALAIECPARLGAHLDPAEWSAERGPDGIRLTSLGERAHHLDHEVVVAAGNPELDVVTGDCPCGRVGSRILVTA
jgi:hypothetical protein